MTRIAVTGERSIEVAERLAREDPRCTVAYHYADRSVIEFRGTREEAARLCEGDGGTPL